ncbi:MAG: glycoside hydrolase family 2 protein [Aristaeellaceae bacterium]
MKSIPRSEYPRPQFVREGWMNLNGEWMFEVDPGCSGKKRGLIEKETLAERIVVPFCPESRLSGIGNTDFMPCVWYKRKITLPEEAAGKRVFLHFGAVDFETSVYVNGEMIGMHVGGYTSFRLEMTKALRPGENLITVCAQDDTRSKAQLTGKQSESYESHECFYTRTTGIWQTVWIEWTNQSMIDHVYLTPDAANGRLWIRAAIDTPKGCTLHAEASYQGGKADCASALCRESETELMIQLSTKELWNVGDPRLYDLTLTLEKNGETVDTLQSYFGLRDVGFDGMRFMLNGKALFQRLILDQGFYPDGIYTAPTDAALKKDIELSMAMGFNGARLHQKVFEARYLYWADHLGYLCWGEMPSWGLGHDKPEAYGYMMREWLEAVKRDYSAPCIIGWCPFNETWDVNGHRQCDDVLRMTYRTTKALDGTRPVIDTSGNYHVETDIFDVHDYEQDVAEFTRRYGPGTEPIYERFPDRQQRTGSQPVFVSEYGGIRWTQDPAGWGYGQGPRTKEEFLARYEGLTNALLDNPDHFGLCYTQLTDVEQEQNGLYDYDRNPKFPPEVIRRINSRKAACED